jgi:hypothetical protein
VSDVELLSEAPDTTLPGNVVTPAYAARWIERRRAFFKECQVAGNA